MLACADLKPYTLNLIRAADEMDRVRIKKILLEFIPSCSCNDDRQQLEG